MKRERFDLAPMTFDLKAMTWFCWLIPVALGYGAYSMPAEMAMHPLARAVRIGVPAFILAIYASVYLLFRPVFFEVTKDSLGIVWPLRSRRIARSAVRSVKKIDAKAFRAQHGRGMRIGAGGLAGGFGLLKTTQETFSMWISRTDAFVLVELEGERTLMLTPEDPDEFVAALR